MDRGDRRRGVAFLGGRRPQSVQAYSDDPAATRPDGGPPGRGNGDYALWSGRLWGNWRGGVASHRRRLMRQWAAASVLGFRRVKEHYEITRRRQRYCCACVEAARGGWRTPHSSSAHTRRVPGIRQTGQSQRRYRGGDEKRHPFGPADFPSSPLGSTGSGSTVKGRPSTPVEGEGGREEGGRREEGVETFNHWGALGPGYLRPYLRPLASRWDGEAVTCTLEPLREIEDLSASVDSHVS